VIETRRSRVVALLSLAVALGITCLAFGTLAPNPDAGRYPSTDQVAPDPATYVGDPVVIDGDVEDTAPLTVSSTYTVVRDGQVERGTATFVVTGVATRPTESDVVQVYGVLREDETIGARRVVVTPTRNVSYMYAVSAVAGLWALLRLSRRWRLDRQRLAVVPRDDALSLDDVTRHTRALATEDEPDA
jgi:hypothetical protein